ncbi:tRNA isopentenyltransferase [Hyphopichia burtonii NRRL Y-1933]|uniref:tRNA dimethylallyltransferase n=1 Tax=Hyphopichia burtonii NRRL Y-1933 TaxID=984485 RepID=A0A1E4RRC5_9ASCO|nr:tRNA isopentenyltransferase [Hyphopichia burtonii NRRL Y-1933]ODV69776.1 tRNA isopentenyltransferase [Hyphopichia burtonii NRRL Y-1933]
MISRYFRFFKNRIMTKPKKNIISIIGTTGVGKSQFSIELAKKINGEIINADSMQVYKDLPIITNKHPIEEREGIAHHVMDHVNWNEDYFIHRFKKEAQEAIDDIHSRGKVPIVIGGTHYYLQNLLFNNKTVGEKEPENKRKLSQDELKVLDGPVEVLFETLNEIDPIIGRKFHPSDQRKLRRALEIYYTTGQRPSDLYKEQKLDELEDSSLKYNTLFFWVYSDYEVLKERLDARVDTMMELGAIAEIRQMYEYYHRENLQNCTSGIWQVIGFKEFLPWLEKGQAGDFDEGIERMKIRTRQYAKSQIKWIKKLLAVELNKESRFGYKYGGKLYLLDATSLAEWSTKVADIGSSIAGDFIAKGPTKVLYAQAPEHLMSIFPNQHFLQNFKSNKTLEGVSNWQHFECEVCKDKHGHPLVAVGEDNFAIHLNSRRHKKAVGYMERKRKHEEMVEKYKKPKVLQP